MKKQFEILVINPGSTSTKIAVFANRRKRFEKNIAHGNSKLAKFKKIADQKDFRKNLIESELKKNAAEISSFDIIVGRGGLTKSIPGGVYKINKKLLRDVKNPDVHGREHASNLGSLIAYDLAKTAGIEAITLDPVATDELTDVARISGFPEIERKSLFHALNIKAVGGRAAKKLRKKNAKFIIAHMGGGISIACY